jgi:hypothetical protein
VAEALTRLVEKQTDVLSSTDIEIRRFMSQSGLNFSKCPKRGQIQPVSRVIVIAKLGIQCVVKREAWRMQCAGFASQRSRLSMELALHTKIVGQLALKLRLNPRIGNQ